MVQVIFVAKFVTVELVLISASEHQKPQTCILFAFFADGKIALNILSAVSTVDG